MIPNEFTRRYAIRLPDGSLYTGHNQMSYERACQAYSDFMALPSAQRDMAHMLGVGGAPTEPPPPPTEPLVFTDRASAESALRDLRSMASSFGVLGWGGCVVESLSTPFTSGDPARDFAEQITAWLHEQGGAQ